MNKKSQFAAMLEALEVFEKIKKERAREEHAQPRAPAVLDSDIPQSLMFYADLRSRALQLALQMHTEYGEKSADTVVRTADRFLAFISRGE